MASPLLLGLVPSGRVVGAWAVSQLALTGLPRVESVLRDLRGRQPDDPLFGDAWDVSIIYTVFLEILMPYRL